MSIKKLNVELDLKKAICGQTFEIKQANSHGIVIEGFANKATVDRGDEIIATDAWELDNFKRNPIILFNHGMDTLGGTPVGKATEIRQTDDGLYLKVKLSNSQAPGIKMVRELVEERILKAFSVGFNPKQIDTVELDGKSVRRISKAELFEVSIVGVPMNQDSLFELSEKSLTTKSFHQLKGEILLAKKAEAAGRVEEKLATCGSRKDVMLAVAKFKSVEMTDLLDMLAGDKELSVDIETAFDFAIKQIDLKLTLEEALASLSEGASQEDVAQSLMSKLGEMDAEEASEEESEKPAQEGEGSEEKEGIEEKPGDKEEESGEDQEIPKDDSEDPKRKADFQDCVNGMVPKLVAEGMEQDQAVATAIAKCQEEGKCQLTPESKQQVFQVYFDKLGDGKTAVDLTDVAINVIAFEKAVDDAAQGDQPPTTPIKTEDNPENFGSPHLEAAKQTNVLLGALIVELQNMSKKLDGLSLQNSVESEQDKAKDPKDSSDIGATNTDSEDHAAKILDSLNRRLKSLGY